MQTALSVDVVSREKLKAADVLPLETIRAHTKTDDTPTVLDDQIALYRDTAFEQAELYTGRMILGAALVREMFRIDVSGIGLRRNYHLMKLKYEPLEKVVYVSNKSGRQAKQVYIKDKSRKITVPTDCMSLDFMSCCNGGSGLDYDALVSYSTGYKTADDIPNTILYGCLKFIMWAIANPGDELLTVRNRLGTTETGLIGTNNGAWASGAIEHWMSYKVK
jgi:hypothetical protein